MLTNFHMHSRYCDGRGELREFAEIAFKKGFSRIGFSGHSPVPFPSSWNMPAERLPAYLADIAALQAEYRGRLDILAGLEIDYVSDIKYPPAEWPAANGLDYFIGAVHFMGFLENGSRFTADSPAGEFEAGLRECFNGDVEAAVRRYYELVAEMALALRPPVVAHIDVIMKNNIGGARFSQDAKWYRDAAIGALEAVKRAGSAVEVNTGGKLRNPDCPIYPAPFILKEMKRMGIPAMINSDAHRPEDIDGLFGDARALLGEAGFDATVAIGTGGTLEEYPL